MLLYLSRLSLIQYDRPLGKSPNRRFELTMHDLVAKRFDSVEILVEILILA